MAEFNQVMPAEVNYVTPSKMTESRVVSYKVNCNVNSTSTPGTELRFVIPMTERQFLEPSSVSLSGKLRLVAGAERDTQWGLLGSGWYSCFKTQQVQLSNGQFLENIPNVSILVNEILQQTADVSQRNALAMTWGMAISDANDNSMASGNCGIILGDGIYPYSANGTVIECNFCIPLIGLLSSTSTYLPMFMSDMTLIMTVNDIIGSVLKKLVQGAAHDGVMASFTLSDLYFNFDALELSQSSYAEWISQYPNQRFVIKTLGYTYTNNTIQNGYSGSLDMPLNFNLASCKQLFVSFQPPKGDLAYGSINPNANSIQLFTGAGEMYPSRPIDFRNPSEVFYHLQKAWNAFYSRDSNGLISPEQFCRRTAASTNYLATSGANGATLATADLIHTGAVSNKFYVTIDTEKATSNRELVYNGAKISLNSYLRLDIAADNAVAIPVHIFACYDSFIICDMANMTVVQTN